MASRDDAEVRGRVRRLLEYLRESVSSQSKPVRAYGPSTRLEWLYRPERPLDLDESAAPGEPTARIRRVSVVEPPALPADLSGKVDGPTNSAQRTPRLSPSASSAARASFDSWIGEWKAWAKEDERQRPYAAIYQSLDRMRDDLITQPESMELVMVSGLLTLKLGAVSVDMHLFSQAADITRDDVTGDLVVALAKGSVARLEDRQILAGLDVLDPAGSATVERALAETVSTPLSPDTSGIMTEWARTALSGRVRVVADASMPPAARVGTLRSSPALVLRRRSGYALVSYYDAMITALDNGSDVPLGLAQLVESINSTDRMSWLGQKANEPSPEPLYPLPINRAQSSIVDRLAIDTSVVVEGPPGTGKTHTIANVMSALMARGERVLVTSQKSQALRVLKDKLPPELQELCVSITDLARGGSEELDRSVAVIADRKADFDADAAERRIEDLTGRRNQLHYRRYALVDRLKVSRTSESETHDLGSGYIGTLSGIMQKLSSTESTLGWIPGPLFQEAPPIPAPRFAEFIELVERVGTHRTSRTDQVLPELGSVLPSVATVRRLCDRARRREQTIELPELSKADLRRVAAVCRKIESDVERLDPHYRSLVENLLSGRFDSQMADARHVGGLIEDADAANRLVGDARIDVDVIDRSVSEAFDALVRLHDEGPFDSLRWLRTPREQTAVDKLNANATVDGRPARGAEDVRVVAAYLRSRIALDDANRALGGLGVRSGASHSGVHERIADLRAVWSNVRIIDAIWSRATDIERDTFGRMSIRRVDHVRTALDAVESVAMQADTHDALDELSAIADGFDHAVGFGESPESRQISDAVRMADFESFESAVGGYAVAVGEQAEQQSLAHLGQLIDGAAPTLYQAVIADRVAPWTSYAPTFDAAWSWRWTRQTIEQKVTRPDEVSLDEEFDELDLELRQVTATLAAESAWRGCLERMTTTEMQALRTYQDSVSSLGLGGGKHAQRFRAAARAAMREAQTAVPAWIMPISEVLSSIPPNQNSFDVVIVDEASQAELSSIFLMWLAPRVIVVGDDRQCAPDLVPQVSQDSAFRQIDHYLSDLPIHIRTTFKPGSSLFSLLRNRSNELVRLREHFRSVPEIIGWSSAQFYADRPLEPVRQFGAERLQPVRSTYVPDAGTTGASASLTNVAEAARLVEQVCDCLADPDYADSSFGIAVLQSAAQAKLVRSMLFERVSPEQRDERRLRVGTPPEFQGDERDVMFLSMVVGPDSSFNALTSSSFQRRLNVAMSRARDQVWLFHSVPLTALTSGDLRASMLGYIEASPTEAVPAMPDVLSGSLLQSMFPSLTTQRVFLALRDRGYHVNPSVQINELTLDLVVTGAASKLAVECDDERLRTAHDIDHGLVRELELRRSGWTFVRVRASDFAAAPDRALVPVIETLDALGIIAGEVDTAHAGIESTWRPIPLRTDEPLDVDDDLIAAPPVEMPKTVEVPISPLPPAISVSPTRTDTSSVELEPGETRPPVLDGSRVIRVDSRYGSSRPAPATTKRRAPFEPAELVAVIRTAMARGQYSVARIVGDHGVTTAQVAAAVNTIRAEDNAALRAKRAAPTPRKMPSRLPSDRTDSATIDTSIEALPTDVQAHLASLPAATRATARVIILAAARPNAPLTVRRCSLLTGLTPTDAETVLADLEVSGKLTTRRRSGTTEWIKPVGGRP